MNNSFIYDSNAEGELARHGVYATTTRGTSMEPLFKTHRDVVIIKRAEGEFKKYDVILYKGDPGQYILHRVIGVLDDCYITRGDNTFVKERVPKSRVIGILTEFNRKGKHHTVDEFGYKIYSRLWNFIYPLRKLKRTLRRFLGRVYRFFFPRKKK